jgi:adenylate kinase family enzyme
LKRRTRIHTITLSKIHIMGAPGAGVTTIGRAVATQLGVPHFDIDDYHWFTTDPEPYRRRRNPDHRSQLLTADLEQAGNHWVLTGSLCGWGDGFIPLFDCVVYCWAPAEERLRRISEREHARYGPARLAPEGDLHSVFEKFKAWAAAYDDPNAAHLRSKVAELDWLRNLSCPVLLLDTPMTVEAAVEAVATFQRTQKN